MFKLNFLQDALDKKITKKIVLIDEAFLKKFQGKSWIAKAKQYYDIEVMFVDLGEEFIKELNLEKGKQAMGNRKKT
jgi:GMP synthase PP-ATPase subunit